jgi:hypothetical protein
MRLKFLMNMDLSAMLAAASPLVALARATHDPHRRPGGAAKQQNGPVISAYRRLSAVRSDDLTGAAQELLVSHMGTAAPATIPMGRL